MSASRPERAGLGRMTPLPLLPTINLGLALVPMLGIVRLPVENGRRLRRIEPSGGLENGAARRVAKGEHEGKLGLHQERSVLLGQALAIEGHLHGGGVAAAHLRLHLGEPRGEQARSASSSSCG